MLNYSILNSICSYSPKSLHWCKWLRNNKLSGSTETKYTLIQMRVDVCSAADVCCCCLHFILVFSRIYRRHIRVQLTLNEFILIIGVHQLFTRPFSAYANSDVPCHGNSLLNSPSARRCWLSSPNSRLLLSAHWDLLCVSGAYETAFDNIWKLSLKACSGINEFITLSSSVFDMICSICWPMLSATSVSFLMNFNGFL